MRRHVQQAGVFLLVLTILAFGVVQPTGTDLITLVVALVWIIGIPLYVLVWIVGGVDTYLRRRRGLPPR